MIGLASVLLWAKRPRSLVLAIARARRALGRPADDALAVELRRAAARPRRARRGCATAAKFVAIAGARWRRRRRRGADLRLPERAAARLRLAVARRRDVRARRADGGRRWTSRASSRCSAGAPGASTTEYRRAEDASGPRGDVRLAHDPDHRRRRAGRARARAYVALLVLAFRRLLRGARGDAGAGGDRGRVRRARAAHVALRRLPRGPGDVDAARARLGARGAGARARAKPRRTSPSALNGHRKEPDAVPQRARDTSPGGSASLGLRPGGEDPAFSRRVELAATLRRAGRRRARVADHAHVSELRLLLPPGLGPRAAGRVAAVVRGLRRADPAPALHRAGGAAGPGVRRERGPRARAGVLPRARRARARHLPARRGGVRALERRAGRAVRRRERVVPALRRARVRGPAVPRARGLGRRARRRRIARGAPVLLVLAGLLRPEAWVLTGSAGGCGSAAPARASPIVVHRPRPSGRSPT